MYLASSRCSALLKWYNKKMKKATIIKGLKNFFQSHAEKYQVSLAFLFGSWAAGIPKSESDIDIAVVFKDKPSEDEIFNRVTNLSSCLAKNLDAEVNVLSIDLDFRQPMLYYNAIVLGIPVYIRDFRQYADIKNKALFEMEDFSIFGRRWQLQLAAKKLKGLKGA